MHRIAFSRRAGRAAAALLATLAGVFLASQALHWPSPTGIDDADITQVYASNIAHGRGIVYQPGGEHVEGSTSFLWTMLNAVFFLFSRHPEPAILVLCIALTWLTLYAALGLYESLCRPPPGEYALFLALGAGFLLAWPAYYAWSAMSLMEIALWNCTLTIFIASLTRHAQGGRPRHRTLVLSLSAAAACLTRQEGVVIVLPLLALYLVLEAAAGRFTRATLRNAAIVAASVVAPLVVLTGFRLAYFGYALPNTFYAKVSSDTAGRIAEGLGYFTQFLGSFYLAAALLAGFAAAVPLAIACVARNRHAARPETAILVPAGAIVAVLLTYIGLGGDHFILARFYQPILPLLPAPAMLALLPLARMLPPSALPASLLAAALGSATIVGGGYAQFETQTGAFAGEFYIAYNGRKLGRALNELSAGTTPPSIGVITAGGIARTYTGRILDLMGLNWVAMAHADPLKQGVRDHASFNKRVFWSSPPDLVAPRLMTHTSGAFKIDGFDALVLRRIMYDDDFRSKYIPVRFQTSRGVVEGYALKTWLQSSKWTPLERPGW